MQLMPGLHMAETTRGGRVYLLVDGINCVLFDTGAPDGTLGAGQLIESAQRKPFEVRMVVLTHAHAGHAGNAAGLQLLTGAPLAASRAAAEQLAHPPPPRRRAGGLLRASPPPAAHVDQLLDPGEILGLCGGIEVIGAPGHDPGSLAYHLHGVGALIVGDAASVDARGLQPPPPRRCQDPAAALLTAERLAGIDARCLAPGHGLPMLDGRLPKRQRG